MSRSEDNPSEANEAGRPIIVDSQGNAGSSETAAPKKAKQPKTSEYAGTHMSESKNLPQNQPAPVIIKQSGSRGLAVGALVLAAALRDPHAHPGGGRQHGGAGAQQARTVNSQLRVGRQLPHCGDRELVLRCPQRLEHCALESPPTTCHLRVRLPVV